MIIIMALLDMIGIASILPFMAVLTNPSLIETNFFLSNMYQASSVIGVKTNQEFIFILGVLVFILLIVSLTFKAFTVFVQVRLVQRLDYSIGKRLVEGYLHQSYSWFLNRHSADVGKTILSEVGQVVALGLTPLMELIAKLTVTITLITLLVLVDPKLTLIIGLSLGGAYGFIFYFIRSSLDRLGKERLKNNQLRYLAINQAFGAAKEIKVGGLEKTFIMLFAKSSQNFTRTQATSQVLALLPRFILEALAFGGVLLIILYVIAQKGSFNNALPILSLYVFTGYRLMPALQQIYASFTQLTFVGPSLDSLIDDLKNLKPFNKNQDQGVMHLNKMISLKNINYNYPSTSRTALKNINITIPSKSIVGLVGTTGSGKSTTVDIILGLLEAQKGTLEVDGKIITKQNSRSWQRSIGYVPQHIYLSDDTVAGNIAFGLESKDIDQEAVEKASRIANLHDFVIDELPKQYQNIIGERGVRLSGGQRQRIGIARALYHNPKVLILDEATSALDNKTEKAVMDAVNNLNKEITIIIIAHRFNTLKNCDIIFKLDKGHLISQGTFEELAIENENFSSTSNNL
ncbi:ABC transporter ATP-binding protein/permease [Candidatus Pelagibacter sp.]|nr:ABC transporter ATP-binding protein/permease [Candidatus Pelagibacter sp.]